MDTASGGDFNASKNETILPYGTKLLLRKIHHDGFTDEHEHWGSGSNCNAKVVGNLVGEFVHKDILGSEKQRTDMDRCRRLGINGSYGWAARER